MSTTEIGHALDPDQLIRSLQARLLEVLGPLVPRGSIVALVDYPNHDNVGDTLIWQGTIAFLRLRECEIGYICDRTSFSARRLTSRVGGRATVLMHGGGNFGDIWPTFQRFRERAVSELHHHPIVQLPQSVEFRDPDEMHRCAEVMNRHPLLKIITRDAASQQALRANLDAEVLLAPDMAFALGVLSRGPTSTRPYALWLGRTDAERLHDPVEPPPGGIEIHTADWPGESRPMKAFRFGNRAIGKALTLSDREMTLASRLHRRMLALHAARRERLGVATIGAARVVVTDRLHAHILCTLLGVPHVLLDNSYGKVSRFHEQWTRGLRSVRWATSPKDALEKAHSWSAELGREIS